MQTNNYLNLIKFKKNNLINYPKQPTKNIKTSLKISINIPENFNFKNIIFLNLNKEFTFLFYNKKFYLILCLNSVSQLFIKNSTIFTDISLCNFFYINKIIKNLFMSYFLTKYRYYNFIKYSGKAYRIIKRKNCLWLLFHYAHVSLFFFSKFKKLKFKRKKKKLSMYSKIINKLQNPMFPVVKYRPVDIFTKRGVRFKQQIIFKKTGKVSGYIV